jgi:hypothetical protein
MPYICAKRSDKALQLSAGIRIPWTRPILLGAISPDLFAGRVGGAIALLPFYARAILRIDATGLGILRAAPALGGIMIGSWLAS